MIPVEAARTSTVIPVFLALVLIHASATAIPVVLRSTALMTTLYSLKLLLVLAASRLFGFKVWGESYFWAAMWLAFKHRLPCGVPPFF